jgi:hypothetical protein
MTPLTLLHREYEEVERYLAGPIQHEHRRDRLEFQRLALQRLIQLAIGAPIGGWQ